MKKKNNTLTFTEWRDHHPRCAFCKYLEASPPLSVPNVPFVIWRCQVKDKRIRKISMPRGWCKCYQTGDDK